MCWKSRSHAESRLGACRRPREATRATAATVFLAALVGCGERGYRPVTGIVTVGGAPVENGVVTFYPQNGRPARGTIGAGGRYSINTSDSIPGVQPGDYAVAIAAFETETSGADPKSLEEELAGVPFAAETSVRHLIDPKYGSPATSELSVTVTPDGNNKHDFKL